jgi:hypothetical protein
MEVIDVKTEATKYQTLQKRYWLVFLIALALFLGALTLLIIYSPTNYGVALWISIILSTLFLWGALYFFSGPYQSVAKRSRFFCHALQGLKSEEDVVIASIGSDEVEQRGDSRDVVDRFFSGGRQDLRAVFLSPFVHSEP